MGDGSYAADRIDEATRAAEERRDAKAQSDVGVDVGTQLAVADVSEKSVEAATAQSIQARARGDAQASPFGFMWFTHAGGLISPWWSRQRDAELRKFWKKPDHLSGAIYTLEARLSTIPLRVVAKDMTIKRHVKQADRMTELLIDEPDFGYGWNDFYEPFLEDFFTQDNGAFGEVIGDGEPDGPIEGPALGIAHLDSWRAQRTGHPDFPIIYTNIAGERFKLHRSRVMFMSSMASPAAQMFKVGFCATSRCINVAQNLLDIAQYKQEKLGSRPLRALGVTSGGLAPSHIQQALRMAAESADNAGLGRYSGIILVGSEDLDEAALDIQDLAGLPDGFDERDSTFLGMAVVALAFGVDIRELFPAAVSGATRADAVISHMKQRGKGYGHIIRRTQLMLNKWFLPPHLKAVFDYQDDAQDAQVAEVKHKRATTRQTNLKALITTERVEREWMLRQGELTKAQFAELELADGRLEDGEDVLILFHDPDFTELLKMDIEDPLDTIVNDAEFVIEQIEIQRAVVLAFMAVSVNEKDRRHGREALAALDALETLYRVQRAPIAPQPGSAEDGGDDDDGDDEVGTERTQTEVVDEEEPDSEKIDVDGNGDEDTKMKALIPWKAWLGKLVGNAGRDVEDEAMDEIDGMIVDLRNALATKIGRKAQDDAQMKAVFELMTRFSDALAKVASREIVVDVHLPEQEPPIINLTLPDTEAPMVNVTLPEAKAPIFKVVMPAQEPAVVKVNAPETKLKVDVTVPAEALKVDARMVAPEVETQLEVERDQFDRIKRIIRRAKP